VQDGALAVGNPGRRGDHRDHQADPESQPGADEDCLPHPAAQFSQQVRDEHGVFLSRIASWSAALAGEAAVAGEAAAGLQGLAEGSGGGSGGRSVGACAGWPASRRLDPVLFEALAER